MSPLVKKICIGFLFVFIVIVLPIILAVVNHKFIEKHNQTAASPPQTAQTTKKEEAVREEKPPCPAFDKAKSLHIMIGDSFTRASAVNPSFDFKRIIGKCYRTIREGKADWQWLSPTSMLYFFYIEDYRSGYAIRIDYDGFEPLPNSLTGWNAVMIGVEPFTYIPQRGGPKTIPRFKIVRFYEAYGHFEDRNVKGQWGPAFRERKKKY